MLTAKYGPLGRGCLSLLALILTLVVPVHPAVAQILPQNVSDDDGVAPIQEDVDQTDPSDPDSVIEHNGNEYCLEWNGFLASSFQIAEWRNAGCTPLTIAMKLRGADGAVRSSDSISLPVGNQLDSIMNVTEGFAENDYGTLCATITSGDPDSLDAQLATYNYSVSDNSFASALVSHHMPPRAGMQAVSYNHYFPTRNASQLNNFSSGYLQIINYETTAQSGELIFYDVEGIELNRLAVLIPAKGRKDYATHRTGPNTVGLIEWKPNSAGKLFRVVLNRYYHAATEAAASRVALVAIPARRPSGYQLATPFSTVGRLAVLEVSNTLNSEVMIPTAVQNSAGALVGSTTAIVIPPKATRHLVLNSILNSQIGSVQLRANLPESIIATVLEYQFGADLRLKSATIAEPKAGFGTIQKTSYNNFFGDCRLRLLNKDGVARTAALTMKRHFGSAVPISTPVTIPARSVVEFNICDNLTERGYGELTITPSATEAITGQLIRSSRNGADLNIALRERSACTAPLSLSGSPLSLYEGGATGTMTVTNLSTINTAHNITSTFAGTPLQGVVTESANSCSAVAPGASCSLSFTPTSGSAPATDFPIQGSNTTTVQGNLEIKASALLTASVNTLALAVGGNSRSITVTNVSPFVADNVTYSTSPALPAGTVIVPASCGTMAPSATCAITIVPGIVPSAAVGDTSPTPVTLSISGNNTNIISPTLQVVTHGSVIQGGYLFAIDDTTPASASIGGSVVTTTDQVAGTPGVMWSSDISGSPVFDNIPGITEASTNPPNACNGNSDGACNSNEIVTTYMSVPLTFYAAGVCKATIAGYADWYLPSVCEMGYDTSFVGSGCGTNVSPTLQNIQSNLVDNGDVGAISGTYWSSTEYSAIPAVASWGQFFATSGGSYQFADDKFVTRAVRCVRRLTN